jgi:ABC-type transport system substrate-binding protein
MIILGLIAIGASKYSEGASQKLEKEQVAVIGRFGADLGSPDPIGASLGPDRIIFPHIYEALVRHPIGDSNAPDFEPDLAAKWEVSPDKLISG